MYFRHHVKVWECNSFHELAFIIHVPKSDTNIYKEVSCLFGQICFGVIDEIFTDKSEIVDVDLFRLCFWQYLIRVCTIEVICKAVMDVVFYFYYSKAKVIVGGYDNVFPFLFIILRRSILCSSRFTIWGRLQLVSKVSVTDTLNRFNESSTIFGAGSSSHVDLDLSFGISISSFLF